MDRDWSETTLGELCDRGATFIQTGPFGSQLHSHDYCAVGVSVIPTEAIGRRVIMGDSLPRISEEKARQLARHRLTPGDILFARRGAQATGLSALIQQDFEGALCGTGAILLRIKTTDIDPTYLSFFLSSEKVVSWLKAHAVGAVMPNLNEGVLRKLPIHYPPLIEQKSISSILDSLDKKIGLNRRMNQTLETMAQALFRSWFVDFDPVRAKLEGRQSEGLDMGASASLSSSRTEREAVSIPEGWQWMPLDEIARFLNGLALQRYPPTDDEFLPVIKIAQLRRGHTEGSDKSSTQIPTEYVINDGDVLFSWSGTLEVAVWTGGRGALNQHLFKVTSKKFPRWFFYFWCKEHLPQFRRIAQTKATTMGHIQRHHLTQALVAVAPSDVLSKADALIAPLLEKQIQNDLENRTLSHVRDTLLPKLLSGEIRVKDAEVQAGAAL